MLLLAVAIPVHGARRRKGPRIPIKPVGLLDWGGNFFLQGNFSGQERNQANTVSTDEQRSFEEGVELNSRGYIYHPNLVDWDASIRMGLSQEWVMLNDADRKTNGTLLGYNLSSIFLKEKPVSVRVFANQSQSIRDQSFSSGTRGENQRMGATARLKGKFPASLLVETGTNTEESERRLLDSAVTHINFKIGDRRYGNWLTELEFDREDIDKTSTFLNSGQTTGEADDESEIVDAAKVSNTWKFGPENRKHSLAGSVILRDRKGFFPSKQMTANQQLDLMHSKTFSSFYRAGTSSYETEAQIDEFVNAEIGIRKKFYESLDVTLRTNTSNRTIGEDEEEITGGFFDADYRKKTPIGLYTSTLHLGRQRQAEISSQGDERFNQDRSVTLNGLAFSFLSSDNVVDSSIVVTDNNNTQPAYIRGVDYQIRKTGQITEIARLAGGVIADPETVFVDFNTEGTGDVTFQTDHLRWRQNMALKKLPLSVYTNYVLRDETLLAGNDPGNLDIDRAFTVGTELDWKGLRVVVEREQRESLISLSSVSHRARASYTRSIGRNSRLSLNAHIANSVYSQSTDTEFGLEEQANKQDTIGAGANFTTKIGANTLLRLMSTYRTSEGRENNTEFNNGFSLQWQYGKMDLSLDGSYDMYEQEEITGTAFKLMFYLKRKF